MNTALLALFLSVSPCNESLDTVLLQGVDIVASIKMDDDDSKNSASSTTVGRVQIENRHLSSLKELSTIVPNFYQPDYGSRMTSSIYVRGFGSRIDQPVVGLNVDEVPMLNKNSYDFDFFDISKVQIVRGAQSTLYGRNTVGGAINIATLSPLTFQGKRLMLEYGNDNLLKVKASHYEKRSERFGWSVSMQYGHSDGHFLNRELGENCDGGDNMAMRARVQFLPSDVWSIDNSFSIGYVDEGGYAYRAYDAVTGILAPVAYNDPCTYRRFNVADGLVVKRLFDNFTLSSVTGYSYIGDRMRLDNDFLPLEYFSMGQYQTEHSLSQEFVAKSSNEKAFKWLAGLFAFYKYMNLDAPVLFKQYGIDNLILKNANANFNPEYHFMFRDDTLPIEDEFEIPAVGTALYGQLSYSLGCFDLSAGLRVDYEYSSMDYNSYARLVYKRKDMQDFKEVLSTFKGSDDVDALELLPRFAVTWNHSRGNVYATVSKGFKAGGFNTQLFSDILQSKIAADMMSGSDTKLGDVSTTVYHPETSWNYELGTHISPLSDGSMTLAASIFFIDCHDQQLTVFPKGMSTGRMMSNAGRSQSYGCEASISYTISNVTMDASYGYTHATFKEYESGDNDYSGKYLPFAPRETVSANIVWSVPVSREFARSLILNVGWNGIGRICWNEDNSLTQAFYGLWSASVAWEKGHLGASLWGKNLLDEEYNTFYFRSIGNDFFAQGKPLQIGLSLYLNL